MTPSQILRKADIAIRRWKAGWLSEIAKLLSEMPDDEKDKLIIALVKELRFWRYSVLLDIAEAHIENWENLRPTVLERFIQPSDPEPLCGVYFIRSGQKVKVGCSVDIRARMRELGRSSPEQLELLAWIGCDDGRQAFDRERAVHMALATRRLHGEWFDLTLADVAEFVVRSGGTVLAS